VHRSPDLALDAVVAEAARPRRDVREHRGADASATVLWHDGHVADGERRPRLDVAAGDRLGIVPGDEIGERLRLRLELEAKILDRSHKIRCGPAPHVDQRLEIRVARGLDRRDRDVSRQAGAAQSAARFGRRSIGAHELGVCADLDDSATVDDDDLVASRIVDRRCAIAIVVRPPSWSSALHEPLGRGVE
jgi:prepilin-type processing-associated H-X9-DG protein